MKLISLTTAVTIALGGILAASPAMADKDDKGKGKGGKHDRGDQRDERRDDDRRSNDDKDRHSSGKTRHFEDRQYVVVREYYTEHYNGRSCPPGLAKKNNGCKPPGHAKKWRKGYPLPREVIYYTVPAAAGGPDRSASLGPSLRAGCRRHTADRDRDRNGGRRDFGSRRDVSFAEPCADVGFNSRDAATTRRPCARGSPPCKPLRCRRSPRPTRENTWQ